MTTKEGAKFSFEEQETVLKEILSRKPTCKFDDTQPDFASFQCPVCMDVTRNPVVHSCGNMFCRDCVKSVTSCPMCREACKENDFNPPPKVVTNRILSFKVICEACNESMTYEAFKA